MVEIVGVTVDPCDVTAEGFVGFGICFRPIFACSYYIGDRLDDFFPFVWSWTFHRFVCLCGCAEPICFLRGWTSFELLFTLKIEYHM